MNKTITTILFVITLLISSGISYAQPADDRKDEIMKVLKQKFMDKVQVDETTADKFFELFRQNQKNIKDLNKEKRETLKYLEDNVDAPDISAKLDNLVNIEDRIVEYRRQFYNDIKQILTPKQIAQSIILQNNFRKTLREEIGKKRGRDNDGPGRRGKNK